MKNPINEFDEQSDLLSLRADPWVKYQSPSPVLVLLFLRAVCAAAFQTVKPFLGTLFSCSLSSSLYLSDLIRAPPSRALCSAFPLFHLVSDTDQFFMALIHSPPPVPSAQNTTVPPRPTSHSTVTQQDLVKTQAREQSHHHLVLFFFLQLSAFSRPLAFTRLWLRRT